MEPWKRKLRMGMVGGGEGAFIGGVHRMAAALDQQIEMVAGCFSRDPENTRQTGRGSSISIRVAAIAPTKKWPRRKPGCRPTSGSTS